MKVRKFINSLMDKLANLTQMQLSININKAITITILAEIGIKYRNSYKGNIHMLKTIKVLKN